MSDREIGTIGNNNRCMMIYNLNARIYLGSQRGAWKCSGIHNPVFEVVVQRQVREYTDQCRLLEVVGRDVCLGEVVLVQRSLVVGGGGTPYAWERNTIGGTLYWSGAKKLYACLLGHGP